MGKYQKLMRTLLEGRSDASIRFEDLRRLLRRLGFVEKIRGSHHLFRHPDLVVRLNLQARGSKAKPYQVRQVRRVILDHKLGEE